MSRKKQNNQQNKQNNQAQQINKNQNNSENRLFEQNGPTSKQNDPQSCDR